MAEDVLTVVNHAMVYVGLWVLNSGRFISVKDGIDLHVYRLICEDTR